MTAGAAVGLLVLASLLTLVLFGIALAALVVMFGRACGWLSRRRGALGRAAFRHTMSRSDRRALVRAAARVMAEERVAARARLHAFLAGPDRPDVRAVVVERRGRVLIESVLIELVDGEQLVAVRPDVGRLTTLQLLLRRERVTVRAARSARDDRYVLELVTSSGSLLELPAADLVLR